MEEDREIDIALVKKCLKGDNRAFEELIIRHKKKIYSIAYRFTSNSEDALDITQEVFIKAYNSLTQYDNKFKFSSWILKITTNYCLDFKKKKTVETVALDLDIASRETKTSAENVFMHKENKRIIKEAINSLPDEYKILVIMYHNQNLSYDEICDALQLPMTKVKNRLYRARLMLKENLQTIREEELRWTAKELQH